MLKKVLPRQSRNLVTPRSLLSQSQSVSFSSIRYAPSPFKCPAALPPRILQRWQSTDAAQKPEGSVGEAPAAEAGAENPLKKELEQKNREVIDLKDKYLRSVAEFRNLQDRTKRDMDSARQFAIQRFATDLLDSIDNLDRALGSVPEPSPPSTTSNTSSSDPNAAASSESITEPSSHTHSQDLFNLHAGLKMTESILMSTLQKHGLERFDPLEGQGRKFDPRLDEATFFTKMEGKQDGEVFHTQSKGFTLNGRVIRAAKVGVVKNS